MNSTSIADTMIKTATSDQMIEQDQAINIARERAATNGWAFVEV